MIKIGQLVRGNKHNGYHKNMIGIVVEYGDNQILDQICPLIYHNEYFMLCDFKRLAQIELYHPENIEILK